MIGCDPELFLHDGKRFMSAIDRIGGSKQQPRRLLGGFALQEDNVLVEYNIPPAKSSSQFVDYNKLMLEEIDYIAKQQGLKSVISSSEEMPEEELADPRARVFGCDPDFNAWELEPNPPPKADNPNLRSAGGHIHVAMKGKSPEKITMIRVLDMLIGVPLAFMDKTSKRRELYGRAGACRFKPYGVEYRTPSNVWLKDDVVMQNTADIVFQLQGDKKLLKSLGQKADQKEEVIKSAINTLSDDAYSDLYGLLKDFWNYSVLPPTKQETIQYVDIGTTKYFSTSAIFKAV